MSNMAAYEVVELHDGHFVKLMNVINETTSDQTKRKCKLVIIPGNPGLVEFYEQFPIDLTEITGLDVLALSHTGHLVAHGQSWPPKSIDEQVDDKLKCLDRFVFNDNNNNSRDGDNDYDIVLIGHSIGCYVILELLDRLDEKKRERVRKSILLFPTIERMNQAPNGRMLTRLTADYLLPFVYALVYLITTFMPDMMRRYLIDSFFVRKHNQASKRHANRELNSNTSHVVTNMSKSYSCIRSVLHMGKTEMHRVSGEPNKQVINKMGHKLVFYYGTKDRWCPIDYYYDMLKHVDETDSQTKPLVILDEANLAHGFVIHRHQCRTIANMIGDWIKV